MLNTINLKNFKKGNDLPIGEVEHNDIIITDLIRTLHDQKIFSGAGAGIGTGIDNAVENKEIVHNDVEMKDFDLNNVINKYIDKDEMREIFNGDRKLLVSYKEGKFSVFTENNKPIGYFLVSHIVKYLSEGYDMEGNFLKGENEDSYRKGKEIIKLLVFKLKYNKKTGYCCVELSDYKKSGFMADLDLLVLLNGELSKYYEDEMGNDLLKVSVEYRGKIEQNIKKFVFIILNYTVKSIAVVSQELREGNKEKLKKRLLDYSIVLVYRLNIFVQEQLKIIHNQNKNIKLALDENLEIRKKLDEKINILISFANVSQEVRTGDTNIEGKIGINHSSEFQPIIFEEA